MSGTAVWRLGPPDRRPRPNRRGRRDRRRAKHQSCRRPSGESRTAQSSPAQRNRKGVIAEAGISLTLLHKRELGQSSSRVSVASDVAHGARETEKGSAPNAVVHRISNAFGTTAFCDGILRRCLHAITASCSVQCSPMVMRFCAAQRRRRWLPGLRRYPRGARLTLAVMSRSAQTGRSEGSGSSCVGSGGGARASGAGRIGCPRARREHGGARHG